VCLVAQDRVTNIVIMWGLHVVKENNILKLAGVADNCLFANYGAAADKCAVANLSLMVNDAGATDIGRGKHSGILGYPHALIGIIKLISGKSGAQFKNKGLDFVQNFPRVSLTLEKRGGDTMAEIQQILYLDHITSPL
jgi:hypothetical protein